MAHLIFLGCHIIDYWHIAPLDLDFNTSGNICPILFWFVAANITCALSIQSFWKTLWCGICFKLSLLLVFYFGSYWQRKKIWYTRLLGDWKQFINTYGISIHIIIILGFMNRWFFYAFKIQNINMVKPTPRVLYPHITPQTHNFFHHWGSLDF